MTSRPASYATKFVCKHCHKSFVREMAYMEHKCKQMKRAEEIQTPLGQTAWHYYSLWLRSKKRAPPNSIQTFVTSKFYMTFVNFVKFAQSVSLPEPERFIRWATADRDYQPALWCTDFAYAEYIEYLDRRVDPMAHAKISVSTVLSEADKLGIDVAELFDHIHPNDLIQLIRLRKLSPWFLLLSKSFRDFFSTKATPEQQVLIESMIRPEYWATQFDNYPKEIGVIKLYLKELGL